MNKKRVFSGIQPSGEIHLGNYLGAIKNWVALQEKYNCFYSIVDYHAITVPYLPQKMSQFILNTAATLIACGINPKKSVLFIQSEVPEHTELCWIFNSLTPFSELKRMTQFKDKAKKYPHNVNAGLLNYPLLQAADILLYKAEIVPVGKDQSQHIELTREIARKFNRKFGKTFPEPKAHFSKIPRIMSLTDPTKKMSKSDQPESYISLNDNLQTIQKKLAKAVTDTARKRKTDPGNPLKCNLYSLHRLFSSKKEQAEISFACQKAKFGCLECKKILARNIYKQLEPIQKQKQKLLKDPEKIWKILNEGKEKAKEVAQQTLKEVKKKMGLSFNF